MDCTVKVSRAASVVFAGTAAALPQSSTKAARRVARALPER